MNDSPRIPLGVGLLTYLLCIVVPVGLKFFNLVDYSWCLAWVALWGPIAFTIAFFLVTGLLKLGTFLFGKRLPL